MHNLQVNTRSHVFTTNGTKPVTFTNTLQCTFILKQYQNVKRIDTSLYRVQQYITAVKYGFSRPPYVGQLFFFSFKYRLKGSRAVRQKMHTHTHTHTLVGSFHKPVTHCFTRSPNMIHFVLHCSTRRYTSIRTYLYIFILQ